MFAVDENSVAITVEANDSSEQLNVSKEKEIEILEEDSKLDVVKR